jgi:hypothetical protein
MGWVTFWALFSQTHLATLTSYNYNAGAVEARAFLKVEHFFCFQMH